MNTYKYAFLVGAAKSGTTSLAELLAMQPEIDLSREKESDFFARNFNKGLEWYENQFENKSCKYRLDASTSYSAGFGGSPNHILKKISDFSPNAKILYIVRDPIERTWSSYWHAVRAGLERDTFEKTIQKTNCPHITGSEYKKRLNEIYSFFPKKNVLVISFSDFKSTPNEVLRKIYDFLGIEQQYTRDESNTHSNKSFKWRGAFFWLTYVPSPWFQIVYKSVKAILPSAFMTKIKSAISEPVPKINAEQAEMVKSIIDLDIREFEKELNLNITSSKWWLSRSSTEESND